MTEKQLKEFSRTGVMPVVHHHRNEIVKPSKSKLEIWLDYHNHEMELIRTVIPCVILVLQVLILWSLS